MFPSRSRAKVSVALATSPLTVVLLRVPAGTVVVSAASSPPLL